MGTKAMFSCGGHRKDLGSGGQRPLQAHSDVWITVGVRWDSRAQSPDPVWWVLLVKLWERRVLLQE